LTGEKKKGMAQLPLRASSTGMSGWVSLLRYTGARRARLVAAKVMVTPVADATAPRVGWGVPRRLAIACRV
jgi:hypothetical protein